MLKNKIANLKELLIKKYGPGYAMSEHQLLIAILEDIERELTGEEK